MAINENVDAVLTDINGNRNLAGVGINSAQRLMSIADGNQMIVGRAAYQALRTRDKYAEGFRQVKAEIKHGRLITAYQFTRLEAPYLNIARPSAVEQLHPIDLEMTEQMEKPGGGSGPTVRAVHSATEQWQAEIKHFYDQLVHRCTDQQLAALKSSQKA
jgi:hypothetical protein